MEFCDHYQIYSISKGSSRICQIENVILSMLGSACLGMGRFDHCFMASGRVLQSLYKRANSRTGLWNIVNKVKPIYYSQYFEFVPHDNRRKGLSALSGWILNKLLSSSTNLSSHIGSNFINTSGLGPLHIAPKLTFFLVNLEKSRRKHIMHCPAYSASKVGYDKDKIGEDWKEYKTNFWMVIQ